MRAFLRVSRHRLAALFRRRRLDDELDEELRAHLEMSVERNEQRGMTPDQARREALLSLGGVLQTKERYRDRRGLPALESMVKDLRFGARMLRRSPGFALLAIGCLTLGIGANATVFSWIEGVLLRPYPLVADQDRLFAVGGTTRGESGSGDVSWPDFLDLQRSCTLIEAFIAEKITGTTLSVGDRAQRAPGSIVSANYFDAIGVRPLLGRGFLAGEDVGRNAHPVTVISYQAWQERFKGDPNILGQTQLLNGRPHTIVGVAPQGFYGTFVGWAFQFWVPASMQPQFDAGVYKLDDRGARWIEGYVRLKRGVSLAQAQAEISAAAARLESLYPETNRGRGIRLYPLWQTPFNNARTLLPTLGIALGVVAAVLLIVCANVSNLLLVRGFARQREMTIRLAIGASRGRLLRQLLTEGVLLSIVAAAGGFLVAIWGRNLLASFFPPRGGATMHVAGNVDWRVFAVGAAVCLVSTLLFGLVPALVTRRIDLAGALRTETAHVGARGRAWVRSALVFVQVALSFVLLVDASLLIQSLQRTRHANPGFTVDGVVTTSVDLFAAGYDVPRARIAEDELLDRVRAMPGVESAAFSRTTPFGYRTYSSAALVVPGQDAPPDQPPTAEYNEISPGYFATLGIPLVSGREFSVNDDDRAPHVVIVDDTFARRYWPGQTPVGQRLQVNGEWMQIVGVARTANYHNLAETPAPFFYVPLRQKFSTVVGLHVRTASTPAALASALVREVHALDANVSPGELITMREQVERTTAPQRVAVTLLAIFSGVALALAAIGLYGVMSFTVSQSRRELGLRLAFGANGADVLRLVLSRGLVLTAGGVLLGAVAAFETTRLMGYLLYEVSPRDPVAFGQALAVIAAASIAACVLPAWRATRTDPLRALRE